MKYKIKYPSWANKYSLTVIGFIIWVALVDGKYSWVKQYKLRSHLNEMVASKAMYEEKLREAKINYQKLLDNKEKYAREKYFVSRPNEDVFIIEK